tara:strand:+ start:6398 stop:6577 length:180 start_codon:yes stop_codon:yes gene_type:complete
MTLNTQPTHQPASGGADVEKAHADQIEDLRANIKRLKFGTKLVKCTVFAASRALGSLAR